MQSCGESIARVKSRKYRNPYDRSHTLMQGLIPSDEVERQALHPSALDTVRRRAHDSKLKMQAENKESARGSAPRADLETSRRGKRAGVQVSQGPFPSSSLPPSLPQTSLPSPSLLPLLPFPPRPFLHFMKRLCIVSPSTTSLGLSPVLVRR